jgi:hypothetical protein
MTRFLNGCIVTGISTLLCLPAAVFAGESHGRWHECSAETLDGLYVFSGSGHSLVNGVWQPKAIVENIQFNGDGTLTVPAATVANRAGDGAVTRSTPGGTGTYALAENCTGTLQFTPGPSFDVFASPLGLEFHMIQTNPNNVLQGTVSKVSR